MTTALPPSSRSRPGSSCLSCAPGEAIRVTCARRATGFPTSSSPPSWPRAGRVTPSCPRRAATTWRGWRPTGCGSWTRWMAPASSASPGAPTAGAVALPALGQVLATTAPPEVPPVNGAAGPGGRLRVVVSRTRPPAFLQRLSEETGMTLLPLGSAGAKAAAVLRGEADAYVHAGGQYEWDSAAPAAVALAAGLHASRLDGSALRYNQPDPMLPDILICPV